MSISLRVFDITVATAKPMARFASSAQQPKSKTASGLLGLHVYSTPDREEC